MKPGDKIRVTFHDHPEELATVCTVTGVFPDGVVKATIDDQEHQFHQYGDKVRELHVAPSNYETV